MKLIVAIIFIIFPFLVHAQSIVLNANVNDCEGSATGSVEVYYGSTKVANQALSNGSARLEWMPNSVTDFSNLEVAIYPNPVSDGRVTIRLNNAKPESTQLEFFNTKGQNLGKFKGTQNFRLSNVFGIVLYTIKTRDNIYKGMLLSHSNNLQGSVAYLNDNSTQNDFNKSAIEAYTIRYLNVDQKILKQESISMASGTHTDLSWTVCATESFVYENPCGSSNNTDFRTEGNSRFGGTATWSWYGAGNTDKHLFIYFENSVLNRLGNTLKLTVKYRAGNNSPGLDTNNNTPNAFRVGLFNNHGVEVPDGSKLSNVEFADYTGYFGGFAVKASNSPELFERETGNNNLILEDIGKSLGTGVQTGNMQTNQERELTFQLERVVDGIQLSMSQSGSNGTFNFLVTDTEDFEEAFNTIALGFDDLPELFDYIWFDYINLEFINYTPVHYYELTVHGGTGSGTYKNGNQIEIRANASPSGKVFDRWEGDTETVLSVNDSITKVTMESDIILTAVYKDIPISNLIVNSGSGSGTYPSGHEQLIVADAPPAGKVFDKWTGDTEWLASVNAATTTLVMPEKAVNITASFRVGDYEIIIPIEIMGPPPYSEGVNFDLGPTGSSDAKKLFVQVHNISYDTKGRLRVNGGEWIKMTNDNSILDLYEPDKSYGGFAGGFATIRFTIDKSQLNFKNGVNTVEFEYTHHIGPTAGYRVINMNVIDGNGDKMIAESKIRMDDPTTWTPPLNNATDIAAGKVLWETVDLAGTEASCTHCHTNSGMDLKYFNVSNKTLIQQAMKSNLTEMQGKQIASYIRSIDIPIVPNARVWNPAYQPGPGIDSKPVYEWAAGAGLDAVLDSDEEMLPYIIGDGSRAAIDAVAGTRGTMNLREMPVAVQFPDWIKWIPRTHPIDIWGKEIWENSPGYRANSDNPQKGLQRVHTEIASPENAIQLAKNRKLIKILEKFAWDVMFWIGHDDANNLHPWCALNAPTLNARNQKYSRETAKHCLATWQTMKMWEVMMKYELQDKAIVERPTVGPNNLPAAEKYNWPCNRFLMFVIPAHFTGDKRGDSHFQWESQLVGTYFSSIWYQVQMTVNPGMRSGYNVAPVDWCYNTYHINLLGERSGIYEPLRMTQNLIKCYQQRDKDINGKIETPSWGMREVSPWRVYSDWKGHQGTMNLLNDYQSGLRARVTSSLMAEWLRKSNEYDLSKWPRTNNITIGSGGWEVLEYANYDPTGKKNPGTNLLFSKDGSKDAVEAHAFWNLLNGEYNNGENRLEEIGVDPVVIKGLADWADKIWTNPSTSWYNWE